MSCVVVDENNDNHGGVNYFDNTRKTIRTWIRAAS